MGIEFLNAHAKETTNSTTGTKERSHVYEQITKTMEETKTIMKGIVETWDDTGDWRREINNCLIFHHGPEEGTTGSRGRGGVAIILGPEGIKAWKRAGSPNPKYIEDVDGTTRFISIELKMSKSNKVKNMVVMCIYAPTTNDPTETATKFMDLVEEEVEKAHNENKQVVMGGDFNAKIGRRRENDKGKHFGPEGLEETNERGEMWRDFIICNNLFVCDTYFKAKKNKKHLNATFQNTLEDYKWIKNDYIFASESLRSRITNTKTSIHTPPGTDHLKSD